jgi:iron-sulfur cluster assembly accessory protein
MQTQVESTPAQPDRLAEDQRPVALTAKAVEMVKEAMAAENLEGYALRVFIQGGGCSGFQYGLDFDKEPKATDFEFYYGDLRVLIDPVSAMHLEGTEVDYVMGTTGAGFKFNNPGAKSTCGCGSSFS